MSILRFLDLSKLAVGVAVALAPVAMAQDRTVFFDVDDPGVEKRIETWGLDTAWLWDRNVIRGVAFMGKPQVDVIRFSFTGDKPLVNGDLEASRQTEFNERMRIVDTYTEPDTALYFNNDSDGIDPYFQGSNGVDAARWAQLIDLTRQKVEAAGRTVISVAPFNEPDFAPNNVGNAARLREIADILRNGASYKESWAGIRLSGGNTLNNDAAMTFYSPNKDLLDEGATHQLAGSFDTYASFLAYVAEQGDWATNDELHNVMEAMVGAEYGMKTGIWWGTAEYARGEFVKTSDGVRLGYAEHRPNWTAASVYRALDGKVQAFVGESERQARPTSYLFVSKDRDVYFDGEGPQRSYRVGTTGALGYQTTSHKNAERVVNIAWGEDVQPKIGGRYTVVNRQSGKSLEVENGSSENGANIRQGDPSGADYQSWLVDPLPFTSGGDWSYYTLKPHHNSLKTPDVWNWNLDTDADVRLYDYIAGPNQQWILEYVEDGYFRIRSRFSGKYLEVAGGSLDAGANVQLGDRSDEYSQQWRLLPAGAPVEFVAPAAPAGLAATANDVSVGLSWTPSGDSDLKGYNVYRANGPSAPFELIARGLTAATYTDKAANQSDATYRYRVKAADQSLNLSAYSNEVAIAPAGGKSLIASLAFEQDTEDGSGNANDASPNSTASYLTGKAGASALYFNGATFFASLPATVANHRDLTIAALVYWGGGSDDQRLLEFSSAADSSFYLTPKASGGGARFVMKNGDTQLQLDGSAMPVNAWKHIAVSIGETSAALFLDGVKVDEIESSLRPSDIAPMLNYLGRGLASSAPYFKGRIDDLRLYNFALSQEAVASAAGLAAPPAPGGLAASFADGEITLAWDMVPGAASYTVKRAATGEGPFAVVGDGLQGNEFVDTNLSGSSKFFYSVEAVNAMGASGPSEAIAVSILTPAEKWRMDHFETAENEGDAADDADPDRDRVSNFLERAFGGDPKVLDTGVLPVIDDSESMLSIVYRRALEATDLSFTVQESSSVSGPWIQAEGDSEVIDEIGGVQWIRITRPIGSDDSLFLRVQVIKE